MDSDKVKYFLLLKRGKICFSGDIFVCLSMILCHKINPIVHIQMSLMYPVKMWKDPFWQYQIASAFTQAFGFWLVLI